MEKSASILAIGDSWFWYPFPGGSLLNALGPLVATREHTILAFGNNGAEAFDYVHGVYKDQLSSGLQEHGGGISAVFVSGGGNDFAGFNDLRPLLKTDCSKIKTGRGCFLTTPGEPFDELMVRTDESLVTLIELVFKKTRDGTEIVLHNYDYAVPSGKGIFGGKSTWLKKALDDAKVPEQLQQECIKFLIDQLTARLVSVASRYENQVFVIDSRN